MNVGKDFHVFIYFFIISLSVGNKRLRTFEPESEIDSPDHDEDYNSEEEGDDDHEQIQEQNEKLRDRLRDWSLNHNVKQDALKDLLRIINDRIPDVLPKDPRTLLKTPRHVQLQTIGDNQQYWHNGITTCIRNLFANVDKPMNLSIIINIDGLPVYKSSPAQDNSTSNRLPS